MDLKKSLSKFDKSQKLKIVRVYYCFKVRISVKIRQIFNGLRFHLNLLDQANMNLMI